MLYCYEWESSLNLYLDGFYFKFDLTGAQLLRI